MNKFKPGDKVRFKNNDQDQAYMNCHFGSISNVFTIDKIDSDYIVYVVNNSEFNPGILYTRLELIESKPVNPFKPRDVVRYIDKKKLGYQQRIVERLGDYYGDNIDTAVTFVGGSWDYVDSLELAELFTEIKKEKTSKMKRVYTVMKLDNNGTLSGVSISKFSSKVEAKKEAERRAHLFALNDSGDTFLVFESIMQVIPPIDQVEFINL